VMVFRCSDLLWVLNLLRLFFVLGSSQDLIFACCPDSMNLILNLNTLNTATLGFVVQRPSIFVLFTALV
jgi:hypothetical protein